MFEQVGFEAGFENSQRVSVSDVRWEGVPELRAKRLKAQDPMVVMRAGGIVRLMEEDDLRVRQGVIMWRSSVRYGEQRIWRALKVRSRTKFIGKAGVSEVVGDEG